MRLITTLVLLDGFVQCAQSSASNACDNIKACQAGETRCPDHGEAMIQVSASHKAKPSQGSIHRREVTARDNVRVIMNNAAQENKVPFQSGCRRNGRTVPLNETGFATIQRHCCALEMASFIERLIMYDETQVCNYGALNGFVSYYACPGDKKYGSLTTDLQAAQHGYCPWIAPQAATCPVMQSSCPIFPQPPSAANGQSALVN